MFLKCIEMTGFKSFPEKTQMHMSGSIIGVVGPNGSGKSNISDAVRWVLGEQSPRMLRGGMMQDVIFAGTQTRKQRSFCEVTLIFDNTDGRMGSEYSEIEVTRKLYRSGESEFSINNTKCRLKDILELFRDTGIGKEGYSIIGQGRIDEILSEKSTDRRRVFEEAAGIMKYRVRKEEAERKLERTRANLIRVEDILREQAFMIEPLKKQADDATVYLALGKRLRTLDINLFLKNYDKHIEKIAKLEDSKKELEEERVEKEKLLNELNQKLANKQEQARESELQGGELSQQISISMAELERVEGEIRLCDERIANIGKDRERVQEEIELLEKRIADFGLNEQTNLSRLKQIEAELERHKQIASETSKELETLSSTVEDRVRVIETVQSEKVQNIEKMADVRTAVSALEEKDSHFAQRLDEIDVQISAMDEDGGKFQDTLDTLNKSIDFLGKKSEDLRRRFNETVQKERAASNLCSETQQTLEAARREYSSSAASVRLLGDMKAAFEGYNDSVKNLMLAGKADKELGSRIIGTVADEMSVPADYETAVEACLGAALQNVIVSDEYDAKQLIAYLRRQNLGRVTFLPLQALRPRYLTAEEKNKINEDGVLGIASELVSTRNARKAVDFLLGRTVIVKDSDTAIRVMRNCGQAFRVVTTDGDVFNPGGSITGGSLRRERSGLVSRDRREEELRQREQKNLEQVKQLEAALEERKAQRDALQSEIEQLRTSLHDNEIEAATSREKRDALAVALDDTKKRSDALLSERLELRLSRKQIGEEIARYNALQSDIIQSSESRSEDYKRLEDEYNKNAALIDQLKQRLHDAELKSAELFRENTSVVGDNLRISAERQDTERTLAGRRKTLELNAESEENLKQIKAQLEEKQREKQDILDELKRRHGEMAQGRSVSLKALSDLETRIEQTRNALTELAEKVMRAGFNIEKTQGDMEAAQNRLWDTHQLTYANALTEREEIDMTGAQSEADRIREQLRDMGNVNPAAIDEYASLKERMTSLTTQKEDLEKAEADLHRLIASLVSEMRRTFRESFDLINKYFGQTFKDLFEGGRAELILEEGEDIMECGIEIVAEPPGKKLQKITLLSGGEKALTAISLLFALLKINPSPVCILDEIDAALDEANVRKFAESLEKYTETMQFIVISHRKPTMAVCNSLYGLAMEEKGVSKLLSVRLDKENI